MFAWFYYLVYFLFAAAVAFITTPLVRAIVLRYRVMDRPNERKPHEKAIPTMGGLAMCFAFFVTVMGANAIYKNWFGQILFPNFRPLYLALGSIPLIITGILDDQYRINYKWKLMVQFVVALIMIHFGYEIHGITNPFGGETVSLGMFSKPATIIWFLFIINAINFIDGIDGLAAGVSLIAVLTTFVVSFHLNNQEVALLTIILAGSILGFLRYNFYPATIFMGDTGSLFLGFLIASLSLRSAQKSSTAVALVTPIVILGLPILDAIAVVIRRWISGRNVFYPDLEHVHHRLLKMGLSKPQAVILLYLIALIFGATGFALSAARYQFVALILLYTGVIFFIAFQKFQRRF